MAVIQKAFGRLPNAEVRDWLKTDTGTDFGSYISLHYPILAVSTTSANEINPFDEDNVTDTIVGVATPDIDYDAGAGTVTVQDAGNYFIYFAPLTDIISSNGTIIYKIFKNGSAIFTSDAMRLYSGQDPEQCVCHLITTLAAGDVITTSYESQSTLTARCKAGTTLLLLRVTGDFASSVVTTAYDEIASSDNLKTFDDDNYGSAGAVSTTVSGVTFNANGGKFTPSRERMFINLQSLLFDTAGTTAAIENRLTLDNSTSAHGFMDLMLAGATAAVTPLSHTQQIMKAIPANLPAQPTRGMVSSDSTGFTFEKGTSYSMFDISNSGSLPNSFLNVVIRSDSSALGTGDANIFDEDNYSSFSFTDPNDASNKAVADGAAGVVDATIGGNRGITYTKSDGRFTISEDGDYFVMSNLGVDTVTNNSSITHFVQQNDEGGPSGGSGQGAINTNGLTSLFYAKNAYDPITNLLMGIIPCKKGDYLTFNVTSTSADIQDGTSVIIYRLGPVRAPAPGFDQLFDGGSNGVGQPIVQTDDTIDSADKGDQRDRRTEQSPFRMSVNGPLTLRGRARSSLPFNVAAGKRGGKK